MAHSSTENPQQQLGIRPLLLPNEGLGQDRVSGSVYGVWSNTAIYFDCRLLIIRDYVFLTVTLTHSLTHRHFIDEDFKDIFAPKQSYFIVEPTGHKVEINKYIHTYIHTYIHRASTVDLDQRASLLKRILMDRETSLPCLKVRIYIYIPTYIHTYIQVHDGILFCRRLSASILTYTHPLTRKVWYSMVWFVVCFYKQPLQLGSSRIWYDFF